VPNVSWQPPRRRRLGYAAGAGAALVLAFVSGSALGAALPLATVAAVLAILALLDAWYGQVLAVDERGLSLSRGGRVRELIGWGEISRIEAVRASHRGLLTSSNLEIDVGERLVLLSRHRLGADPQVVAAALRSSRPG
jgi:hypothetical protein